MCNRSETVKVACAAWEQLAYAHQTGDFSGYLALLSDDYRFSIPLGPFRGENVGKGRAIEFFKAVAVAKPNLTYHEPLRITASDTTVVFEFDDEGDLGGMPYHNRIAASFDVRDGRIVGYREYFGDIDAEAIGRMLTAVDQAAG